MAEEINEPEDMFQSWDGKPIYAKKAERDVNGNPLALTIENEKVTAIGGVSIGGSTELTDGDGIDITGGEISVKKDSSLAFDASGNLGIADGGVSTSKIADVKDLEADESSLTMSESLSAFTLMVKTGGINLLHLNSKLQPAALQFVDANDNDLDGQDTGFTFADPVDPTEKPLIGKIPMPTPWQGWVDFTLSFEFAIQQQAIGSDKTFLLHVWSGQTMTSSTILDSRTVKVTEDSPFVHERFSFASDHAQDYIYVTFERVDSISNYLLKNVTLKGFMAFGI